MYFDAIKADKDVMSQAKDENSICELMYRMRDAVAVNSLSVALFLSRQIHDKITVMIMEQENVTCNLECSIGSIDG